MWEKQKTGASSPRWKKSEAQRSHAYTYTEMYVHLRIRAGLSLQKKVGALCLIFLDHVTPSPRRSKEFLNHLPVELRTTRCRFQGVQGLAGGRASGVGTRGVAHAAMALARGAGSSVAGVLVVVDARSAQADHLWCLVAQTEATGRAAQAER